MSFAEARVLRERAGYLYRYALVPRLLLLLPLPWAYRAGRMLGRLRYRRQRRSMRPQAAEMRARLGVSAEQVERRLERCFELAVSEDLDWPLFRRMEKRGPNSVIEVVGRKHLDEALARGSGVVLWSGHFFGHFTAFVALSLLGYPMNIAGLFRDTLREEADQWYPKRRQALAESLGCRLLRMHERGIGATHGALSALRANEVVVALVDHTPGTTVEVPFFGAPGFFPSGPVWLARRAGAPLVFFHVRRTERWLPEVVEIMPPLWVDDDVEGAVRHLASTLETAILADPSSWGPWLYPTKFVWSPP